MKFNLFLLMSSLVAGPTFAGPETSGGGAAAICRNANREITFVEMEDLYEGKIRYGLSYPESNEQPNSQILNAIAKIKDPFNRAAVTEAAALIVQSMEFLPLGVGLAPTTDLGNEFGVVVPNGCYVEPVGFYESDGRLKISREVYEKLDSRNRAAFVLHEALYKLARDTVGELNSANARRATATLFATNISDLNRESTVSKIVYPAYGAGYFAIADRIILENQSRKFKIKVFPDTRGAYYEFGFGQYTFHSVWDIDPNNAVFNESAMGNQELMFENPVGTILLAVNLSNRDTSGTYGFVREFSYELSDEFGTLVSSGTKLVPTETTNTNVPGYTTKGRLLFSIAIARPILIPKLPSM